MRPRLPARVPCSSRCRPSWDGQGLLINERVWRPLPARLGRIRLRECHRHRVPRDCAGRGSARRAGPLIQSKTANPAVRPIAGHAMLNVMRTRSEPIANKARKIAVARQAHIIQLGGNCRKTDQPCRSDMTPPQWKTFVFCGGEWWTHLGSNQGPAD